MDPSDHLRCRFGTKRNLCNGESSLQQRIGQPKRAIDVVNGNHGNDPRLLQAAYDFIHVCLLLEISYQRALKPAPGYAGSVSHRWFVRMGAVCVTATNQPPSAGKLWPCRSILDTAFEEIESLEQFAEKSKTFFLLGSSSRAKC